MKPQLAQLRNVLTDYVVESLFPGVRLAVHKSNIAELAESGAGGLLEVVFALGINPDGKHEYVEYLSLHACIDNSVLTDFANLLKSESVPATLHLRSTWTTPTFDVETVYQIDGATTAKDFARHLVDTACAFARSQYRVFVNALRDAGYFDVTEWGTPVARHFLEHLQVNTCQSTAE